ncbi:MAG TPA: GMC family oxidoreductase [Streptosporangiaceae bacterium]
MIERADVYDVIVVGGGTAGAIVAARLVEAGLRLALVEAGPDYGSHRSGRWPLDLLEARALADSHDWGYQGKGAGGQRLAFERARVIGGCSAHNGCSQLVGWRGDYDAWAASGCPGWSCDELRPWFARAAGRLRVRQFSPDEIQPFQQAFLAAAVAAGVPRTDDLDDLDGEVGCGPEPMNVVGGVRWNTAFAYLDPVRDRRELTIVADATVERVLIANGQAFGVRAAVAGQARDLRADLVVLSAGAYGTAEILLRSGIGPSADLRDHGLEVHVDLPAVGANLHDHPASQLEFAGTEQLREELERFARRHWLPEEQTLAKIASPVADGPYDLHVYPWVEPDEAQPTGWRCVVPVGLLTPKSRGQLRLRSADPAARAEVDHAYLTEAEDVAALAHGLRWALQIVRQPEIAAYLGSPLRFPPDIGDHALHEWIRSTHAHIWHPAGTCRMGPDPAQGAVIDARGRVHGLRGLRVADASVFPHLPRATPAWPVAVIGERIADMILERAPRT